MDGRPAAGKRHPRRQNRSYSLALALVSSWIIVPLLIAVGEALGSGQNPIQVFAGAYVLFSPAGLFGVWGLPRAPLSATIAEDGFTLAFRSRSETVRWDAVSAIDIGRVVTRIDFRDGSVRRLLVDPGITTGLRRWGRPKGIALSDYFEST